MYQEPILSSFNLREHLRLALSSIHSLGWFYNPPASTSGGLGLQACAAMPPRRSVPCLVNYCKLDRVGNVLRTAGRFFFFLDCSQR